MIGEEELRFILKASSNLAVGSYTISDVPKDLVDAHLLKNAVDEIFGITTFLVI
jgi:hypothetical protein